MNSEVLQVLLPKDQHMQSNMHELECEVRAWEEDGSCDFESVNDTHPMAVSAAFKERYVT